MAMTNKLRPSPSTPGGPVVPNGSTKIPTPARKRPAAAAGAMTPPTSRLLLSLLVAMALAVSVTNLVISRRSVREDLYARRLDYFIEGAAPNLAGSGGRKRHRLIKARNANGKDRQQRPGTRGQSLLSIREKPHTVGQPEPAPAVHASGEDAVKEKSHTRPAPAGEDAVQDGGLVTEILRKERPFPAGSARLKYSPGTLDLDMASSLRHCYYNATRYRTHIGSTGKQCLVSVSPEHKIIYRNIPKSSSSSARHAMQDFLGGKDMRMKHDDMEDRVHLQNYTMLSFIREPSNRFYSSYDEAFFRMGPWMGDPKGQIAWDKPRIRAQYNETKWKVERFPYLYEGFETINDFRRLYCPGEILDTGKFLRCNDVPSIDDGRLASRFERFVNDYGDGLEPFDVHLNMQVGSLVFPTGEPFPVTRLYNASVAEGGWQSIASGVGVDIPDGEMTHGRKITRRVNLGLVGDGTRRRMCRILALDYCCLNIPLPEVCRGKGGGGEEEEEEEEVYCSMEPRRGEDMRYALEDFVIHPWQDVQRR